MPPSSISKNCSSILSSSHSSCKLGAIRLAQPTRSFSATTKDEGHTFQRRELFNWLNGPGAALKEPLEGSPNYLGAYDHKGMLKRARNAQGGDIPKASGNDLKPFPRSDSFIAQPVTSEAMREAVWEKIMKHGLSVKEVSMELGIEMSRVGAIVRLKEVEKGWQRQVSFSISILTPTSLASKD
jgi:hypothetical protein